MRKIFLYYMNERQYLAFASILADVDYGYAISIIIRG